MVKNSVPDFFRKISSPLLKENICTHKGRTFEKKNMQGDKEHITRNIYSKIYKILLNKIVWSCNKNAQPTNVKTNCSIYNGRNKEKRKTP